MRISRAETNSATNSIMKGYDKVGVHRESKAWQTFSLAMANGDEARPMISGNHAELQDVSNGVLTPRNCQRARLRYFVTHLPNFRHLAWFRTLSWPLDGLQEVRSSAW